MKQEKQNCVVLNLAANDTVMDSSLEIRGTDTPSEKVPHQIFPAMSTESKDDRVSSLFSSIMHKFVKVDETENFYFIFVILFILFNFSFALVPVL